MRHGCSRRKERWIKDGCAFQGNVSVWDGNVLRLTGCVRGQWLVQDIADARCEAWNSSRRVSQAQLQRRRCRVSAAARAEKEQEDGSGPSSALSAVSKDVSEIERFSVLLRRGVAAVALGVVLATGAPKCAHALSEPQKLVAEAWRVVNQSFVDQSFNGVDWFKIRMKNVKKPMSTMDDAYETIRGMLKLLDDPYTRFLSPAQLESLTSAATGELAGVGVQLYPARVDGELKILNPIEGGPAARSGVRKGDIITDIDGESLDTLSPDEAAARIRGSPGTRVSINVSNSSGDRRVDLVRENLRITSVREELVKRPSDGVLLGVLDIRQFNSSTADDATKALRSLQAAGASKYVIDLRNNPGGYFPGGVDVARQFLPKGVAIVYVADKNGVQDEYETLEDGPLCDAPVAVLVNHATASASEILSGALKDNHRATLIGEQTFGKGVVQTISELSDGSGLSVTIARYETPAHIDINKRGIEPDVFRSCPDSAPPISCLPDAF